MVENNDLSQIFPCARPAGDERDKRIKKPSTITQIAWHHFDFWLLGAVAVLVIFGITMIRSAVAGNIDVAAHPSRQLIFAAGGFVLIFLVAFIDYHLWSSINRPLYWGTVIVLFLLNVVAQALFGSARWFQVGLIFIQPSEIAKIVIILVLADFFAKNQAKLRDITWIIRSLLMAMGIIVWVILQPNLSTSIVMLVIWFSMLFMAGLSYKQMALFTITGLVILSILTPLLIETEIIEAYQIDRVTSFLFPDPEARYGDEYNIEQALISIGSGGLFGQGYGHGSQVQLRFLKVRWSDFIFSAIAQEFGLVGAVSVILLVSFVVYRCIRVAYLARDTYGSLIALGVAVLISFQAIVNIGVNLRLMPATGLTLPFVSYGGSSLVANLIGIGLVESVILRHKSMEF
jgi:rod shape determining protein RodA